MKCRFQRNRRMAWVLVGVLFYCINLRVQAAAADEYLSEDDLFDEPIQGMIKIADPLEPLNRIVFRFNHVFLNQILEPLSRFYTDVIPAPVDRGLSRFFRNFRYPVRLTSNLVQGDFATARIETERFIINSTAGLAGFLDPANEMEGLQRPPPQDFGHAFAAYGMGKGPYLMLPILGPSSGRDMLAFICNRAVHPLRYPFIAWEDATFDLTLSITQLVSESPSLIRGYRAVTDNAVDPYSSLKSAYTQNRRTYVREKNISPPNTIIKRQCGL
jgi:phospholipid-binding lipoprotein MlaA